MVNRMSVSLTEFASMLGQSPMLAITALLTIGGNPRQWLDGRAQRHRHLRIHARDESGGRHCHGGGIQFPRRAGYDSQSIPA